MKIIKIKENSLAQEIGLSSGDRLLKINGEKVLDHLDYEFRIADENVVLDLQINGELNQIIVEKEYDDDLVSRCRNLITFANNNPDLPIIEFTKRDKSDYK